MYVPPSIAVYHEYHAVLNDFTWLIKAEWATRDEIKRRSFRLERLLQHYIDALPPNNLRQVRAAVLGTSGTPAADLAVAKLKKVWFDEMAYSSPSVPDPLVLDSRDVNANIDASNARMLFYSWRVAQAYYSIYNSLHVLLQLRGAKYVVGSHGGAHATFKNQMLGAVAGTLVHYPFTLQAWKGTPPASSLAAYKRPMPKHPHYRYAGHPRYRSSDRAQYADAAAAVVRTLSDRASSQGPRGIWSRIF